MRVEILVYGSGARAKGALHKAIAGKWYGEDAKFHMNRLIVSVDGRIIMFATPDVVKYINSFDVLTIVDNINKEYYGPQLDKLLSMGKTRGASIVDKRKGRRPAKHGAKKTLAERIRPRV